MKRIKLTDMQRVIIRTRMKIFQIQKDDTEEQQLDTIEKMCQDVEDFINIDARIAFEKGRLHQEQKRYKRL